jgi:hypothetical protein
MRSGVTYSFQQSIRSLLVLLLALVTAVFICTPQLAWATPQDTPASSKQSVAGEPASAGSTGSSASNAATSAGGQGHTNDSNNGDNNDASASGGAAAAQEPAAPVGQITGDQGTAATSSDTSGSTDASATSVVQPTGPDSYDVHTDVQVNVGADGTVNVVASNAATSGGQSTVAVTKATADASAAQSDVQAAPASDLSVVAPATITTIDDSQVPLSSYTPTSWSGMNLGLAGIQAALAIAVAAVLRRSLGAAGASALPTGGAGAGAGAAGAGTAGAAGTAGLAVAGGLQAAPAAADGRQTHMLPWKLLVYACGLAGPIVVLLTQDVTHGGYALFNVQSIPLLAIMLVQVGACLMLVHARNAGRRKPKGASARAAEAQSNSREGYL